MKSVILETRLLRMLSQGMSDKRICMISRTYNSKHQDHRLNEHDVYPTLWSLLRKGLVYLDMEQQHPSSWSVRLTLLGEKRATEEENSPYDPEGWLEYLKRKVPRISDTSLQYAKEAVHAFANELYLSSCVMLGVSSESAFLELAKAVCNFVGEDSAKKLRKDLEAPFSPFLKKFSECRKLLDTIRSSIPREHSDGMNIWLDSVIDILRIYRNDAGHPTGKQMDREDCYMNLRVFSMYMEKMHNLRVYLYENRPTNACNGDCPKGEPADA
jgi:hypothetical protein